MLWFKVYPDAICCSIKEMFIRQLYSIYIHILTFIVLTTGSLLRPVIAQRTLTVNYNLINHSIRDSLLKTEKIYSTNCEFLSPLHKYYSRTESPIRLRDTYKQKLDSIIQEIYDDQTGTWYGLFKEVYTYDSNENVVYRLLANWDLVNKSWINIEKIDFQWNTAGNLLSESFSNWAGDSTGWINVSKDEYTYNTVDSITFEIYYNWNSSLNNWAFAQKTEYSYDSINRLTDQIFSDWEDSTQRWIGSYSYEFFYDSANTLSERLRYSWYDDIQQWIVNQKVNYIYDEYGNYSFVSVFIFDQDIQNWIECVNYNYYYTPIHRIDSLIVYSNWWSQTLIPQTKHEYIYDSCGYNTCCIHSSYNPVEHLWWGFEKNEYIYDIKGNLTSEINSTWDESTIWRYHYMLNYTYDSFNNRLGQTYSEWNILEQSWKFINNAETTFNNEFGYQDLLLPYYYYQEYFEFSHLPIEKILYQYSDNTWYPYQNILYYFSDYLVTSCLIRSEAELLVYPNPADKWLSFCWQNSNQKFDLVLTKIDGKTILSKSIYLNEILRIDDLPSALYLFKLIDHNNVIFKGKILIDH